MSLDIPFEGFRYHPHQVKAVNWMIEREFGGQFCNGGILADEMGLGKTWMTIGLLLNNHVPTTLILVPPVLQPQWSEALTKANISHRILSTGQKWTEYKGTRSQEVLLATYDRAARHPDLINKIGVNRVICDEGHVLRNGPKTKRFSAVNSIQSDYRWILSGTPIQNKADDFRHLLTFLNVKYDKAVVSDIASAIILRRTVADVKSTVVDFPKNKPAHFIHPVSMPEGSEEKSVYDRLVKRFADAQEAHVENFILLELYLRIRQFIAHPQIYTSAMCKKYKESYTRKEWTGTASKMDAFEKLMTSISKRPTIVFTNFREEMNIAHEKLLDAGYRVWEIAGGMTDSARESVVKDSRKAVATGKPAAILIQIQAGCAGLNLQYMNRIVFLSNHWNPTVMDQAVGRAYRIGQTGSVEVHHLLMADGSEKNLDRYIAKTHSKKRLIAQKIHPKLVCDAAVDVRDVLDTLNEVCPDEDEDFTYPYDDENDESEEDE